MRKRSNRSAKKLGTAAILSFSLVAGACGGGSSDSTPDDTPVAAEAPDATEAPDAEPAEPADPALSLIRVLTYFTYSSLLPRLPSH